MKSNYLPAIIACALVLPVFIWWRSVGNPVVLFDGSTPPGQLLYVFSKLAGLVAITCIGLQLLFICISKGVRTNILRWSVKTHVWFGAFTLALIVLHIGLFFVAASLRSDHLAVGLFKIRLSNGFYDQMVSVGALSMYLLLVLLVAGIFLYRRNSGTRKLKGVHRAIAWMVLLLSIGHSYAIGSETNTMVVKLFYMTLVLLVFWNIFQLYSSRRLIEGRLQHSDKR